jgi:hypothetical protein
MDYFAGLDVRTSAQRTPVWCEQPKSALCKEVGGSGRIAPEGVAGVSSPSRTV